MGISCTEPPDFHAKLGKWAAFQCVIAPLWSCGGCCIVTISNLPHRSTSHFETLQRAVCVLQDPAAYQNKQRMPRFAKWELRISNTSYVLSSQRRRCLHIEVESIATARSEWRVRLEDQGSLASEDLHDMFSLHSSQFNLLHPAPTLVLLVHPRSSQVQYGSVDIKRSKGLDILGTWRNRGVERETTCFKPSQWNKTTGWMMNKHQRIVRGASTTRPCVACNCHIHSLHSHTI